MYSQEEIDHVHDTFIDLIISCMKTYKIPFEEPKIGDWCIEISQAHFDRDNSVGKLIRKYVDDTGIVYEIERIGGKIVTWRNAEFHKIPSDYLRSREGGNNGEKNSCFNK